MKEKMIEEKNDLKKKIQKMEMLLRPKKDSKFSNTKQYWMHEQLRHMKEYLKILETRIEVEKIEEQEKERRCSKNGNS
ncbi:MAG: hypothetical protein EOM19_02210 [Candidatus Moranbacteria bacterium]|nr:hypothetical protein [Candidatus Moranbacteria bacterium]